MTTTPTEFRITVRWPTGDVCQVGAMKALLNMLGRRFGARCMKCSVVAADRAMTVDETTEVVA